MNAPVTTPLELARQARGVDSWLRFPVVVTAIAVIALLLFFWQTAASIVAIWARSDTFVHGFLVVPICIWLAWRERHVVATRTATPWWPGVAFALAAGALWFAASMGNVGAVRQFALAFMIEATIVTIVGVQIARALFFPLAFLLFAVPAGEIFIPTLIDWTANFTVGALRLSGVPVYREGNHFIIPSGAWSVVEACSGVRYLIASTMLGVLFAAITYHSPRRRALFVAASIVVPIVANWLRAYLIVMIGHLTNNRLAAGVDHLIYGWVFFGAVMLVLLLIGARWREDGDARPAPAAAETVAAGRPQHGALLTAALMAVSAAAIWRPLEAAVQPPKLDAHPITLQRLAGNGPWRPQPAFVDWKPRYVGHIAELTQTFANGEAPVGVYIAYYTQQEKGRELVTSTNFLVARDDWKWRQVDQGTAGAPWAGRPTTFERATLRGPLAIETWQLFWIAGHVTSSPYLAKMLLAWAKLTGRGDDSALIVLYTPATVGDSGERLRNFAQAMSRAIDDTLATASGGPR